MKNETQKLVKVFNKAGVWVYHWRDIKPEVIKVYKQTELAL